MVQREDSSVQRCLQAIAKKAAANLHRAACQGKSIAVNKLQIPQSAVGEQNNTG